MKKLTTTITAATVAILLLFTGCDKYHRDRYTGTWDFVTERRFLNVTDSYNLIEIKRDTVYHLGKIIFGNLENELIFQYTEFDEVIAWIDEERYIYSVAGVMLGKYPCGRFENKYELRFDLHWGEFVSFEGESDRRYDCITGVKKRRK